MPGEPEQLSFVDTDAPPAWTGPQLAALLNLDGIGPVGALEIASAWPDPISYDADPGRVGGRVRSFLPTALPEPVDVPSGLTLVGFFDDDYPPTLSRIPNPPPVLWVIGTLPARAGVAVVGTRHPSKGGVVVAQTAAQMAAEAGRSTISGLALGIDAVAHEAALAAGGHTTAVLGGGLDRPSPAKNRPLAHRIIDAGGALVAEVPPGTEPTAPRLVARNRIQAGLAKVVVMAESGVPGGTLHTVRFALEQGKRVAVAQPSDPHSAPPSMAANVALTTDPPDLSILPGRLDSDQVRHLLRPVADGRELHAAITEP